MPADPEYQTALDLVTLRHLGTGLHSGATPALSEAVANAWDADAACVSISTGGGRISIEDDGHGMTVADANEKYLRTGYERRREGGGRTPKGRPVMGRNGIGKLSLFSVADTVTVHSARGGERHGFAMRVRDMEDATRRNEPYRPEPIGAAPGLEEGTRITLSGIRRTVYGASLRRGLARRFSVIGGDGGFEVAVDGEKIGAEDVGYREGLQYVWNFGGGGRRGAGARRGGPQAFSEDIHITLGGRTFPLDGWIGTTRRPRQLRDDYTGEIMNRVAVMARGRAVQEDMLGDLAWRGACRGCIVGEIYADFLDADDDEDIVMAGRQRIREDAPRYEELGSAVKGALDVVERKWNGLRAEEGPRRAREIPQINKWYEALDPDRRRMAEILFGRINRMAIDDDGEMRRLLIGGALAFESLGIRDVLDRLGRVGAGGGEGLEMLRNALLQLDDLDAGMHYQIAKSRLGVIGRIVDSADGDIRLGEAAREHLPDYLWALDPSWERAAGTERMEEDLRRALDPAAANERDRGERLGMGYRVTAGKHIVIDLKRPDVRVGTGDLITQVSRYRKAVRRALDKAGRVDEPVEVVCVVGEDLDDWYDHRSRDSSQRSLEGCSARVVKYGDLVRRAQESYRRHVERAKSASRVYDLITSIGEGDRRLMRPCG